MKYALDERTKGDSGSVCVYFCYEDRWLYNGAGQEYVEACGCDTVANGCDLNPDQLREFAALMTAEADRIERIPVTPPATLTQVFNRVARREMTPEQGAEHIERLRAVKP